MKEFTLNIERVRRVNTTHQHLILSSDPSLMNMKAGQSLLARIGDSYDPYLREQWIPIEITRESVTVERPVGIAYTPSTLVSVIGVVGQPFRYRRTLRSVLLIAHNTPPTPLLLAIPSLIANHVNVTLVLLGSAANYRTEHIAPEVEILIGDDQFNWANRVTTVGWADQVFVVVDPADELNNFARIMHHMSELRADIPNNYLFGVFQPVLPCGVGACGACIVRTKQGAPLACSQGPSFDLTEVKLR